MSQHEKLKITGMVFTDASEIVALDVAPMRFDSEISFLPKL